MFKKYEYDITYVFGNGRKEKIQSSIEQGLEFFYGYPYFNNKGLRVNIIETQNANSLDNSLVTKLLLRILENLLIKFTKLTFYLKSLISLNVIKQVFNSKNIITSNHGVGMTLFFFIKIIKLFKNINFVVINSGQFSMNKVNKFFEILRKLVFSSYLKTVDKIIFTNRSEYNFANKNFKFYSSKFIYIPFSLDLSFWKPELNLEQNEKKGVLFIGNNGHRDFKLVIEIAENIPELEFTFITKIINDKDIRSKNVTNILGDWNSNYLSDLEIKKYYELARLVILPIKNTLVSSGQSAGLQASSVGTTVITTKTIGFWDYENYINNENIIFAENNDLKHWVNLIRETYNNIELLTKVSKNSQILINKEYNLDLFNLKLEECLSL